MGTDNPTSNPTPQEFKVDVKKTDGTDIIGWLEQSFLNHAIIYLRTKKDNLSSEQYKSLKAMIIEYLKKVDIALDRNYIIELNRKYDEFYNKIMGQNRAALDILRKDFEDERNFNEIYLKLQRYISELTDIVKEKEEKEGNFMTLISPENLYGLANIINGINGLNNKSQVKKGEYIKFFGPMLNFVYNNLLIFESVTHKDYKPETNTEAKLNEIRKILNDTIIILSGLIKLYKGVQDGKDLEELKNDNDVNKFLNSPEYDYLINLHYLGEKKAKNKYYLDKANYYRKFELGGQSLARLFYEKIIEDDSIKYYDHEIWEEANEKIPRGSFTLGSSKNDFLIDIGNSMLTIPMILAGIGGGLVGSGFTRLILGTEKAFKLKQFFDKYPWIVKFFPGVKAIKEGKTVGGNFGVGIGNFAAEASKAWGYPKIAYWLSGKNENVEDGVLLACMFLGGAVTGAKRQLKFQAFKEAPILKGREVSNKELGHYNIEDLTIKVDGDNVIFFLEEEFYKSLSVQERRAFDKIIAEGAMIQTYEGFVKMFKKLGNLLKGKKDILDNIATNFVKSLNIKKILEKLKNPEFLNDLNEFLGYDKIRITNQAILCNFMGRVIQNNVKKLLGIGKKTRLGLHSEDEDTSPDESNPDLEKFDSECKNLATKYGGGNIPLKDLDLLYNKYFSKNDNEDYRTSLKDIYELFKILTSENEDYSTYVD